MTGNRFVRALRVFYESYRSLRAPITPEFTAPAQKLAWAREMLDLLNVELTVVGQPTTERPAVFVGNHISYLDVVLLLATAPELSFVSKQELASWPVFGAGARKFDTIFVKREDAANRTAAAQAVRRALEIERRAVALFPSGTTCLDESKRWKHGAFRLARETNSALQVFRIHYEPLRRVAYIDRDFFPAHLLGLAGPEKIHASLTFAPVTRVKDVEADCARWRAWASAPDR